MITVQNKMMIDFYKKEQERKQRHREYNQKVLERSKEDPSFLRKRKF